MYGYLYLPIIIFLARIVDVSFGTVRIIFVAKGYKGRSTILGFFEVLLWIVVIAQIMQNADNMIAFIAYAAGFAMGTYVGMMIEEKLSVGNVIVRIISTTNTEELIKTLKVHNYRLTIMSASGSFGDVKILFTVIKRKQLTKVVKIIKNFNPKAFYSIEDVRFVNDSEIISRPLLPRYSFLKLNKMFKKK